MRFHVPSAQTSHDLARRTIKLLVKPIVSRALDLAKGDKVAILNYSEIRCLSRALLSTSELLQGDALIPEDKFPHQPEVSPFVRTSGHWQKPFLLSLFERAVACNSQIPIAVTSAMPATMAVSVRDSSMRRLMRGIGLFVNA
jgi:hypothetical protein